jgi:hypothetical protein
MFFTARQLEQILRESGKIVLPLGAKLTPAANDLVRLKRLDISFGDDKPKAVGETTSAIASPINGSTLPYLWWSGTKSGPAKAALAMTAREANLAEMAILEDSTKATAAIRHLIVAIKNNSAAGGVLVVEHAGLAVALANRSPRLRAIVATNLAAVDAAIRDVAANVLVIEPGTLPLMVIKNMILRFVRTPRSASEELTKQLEEIAKL